MGWEQLLSLLDELDRKSGDTLKTLQKVIFLIDLLCPREKYTYEQAFSVLNKIIETNQSLRESSKLYTQFLPDKTGTFQATAPMEPPGASPRPYGMAASPSAPAQTQPYYASQPSPMFSAAAQAPEPAPQSSALSVPRAQDKRPEAPAQTSGKGLFHRLFNRSSASSGKSGRAREASDVELKRVDFSAVAPKVFVKGGYTDVKVIMYEEAYRRVVDEMIEEGDKEVKSGIHKARDGSEIKVVLSSENVPINNTEVRIWQGGYLNFTFAVFLPEEYTLPSVAFRADIYINGVIATNLVFTAQCSTLQEQKISVTRNDILSAFVSYAHEDRIRVAAIVQGMQKARPDLDIFFDVNNIRSGEYWKNVLYHEIETRDVLFLCWSNYARQSEWVDEEWRHAFFQKGLKGVEPIPIDPPEVCPPPDELKDKHFNDMLLYFINAESER